MATRPSRSVIPVLRIPAPVTRTRTPLTPLPLRLTTARTIPVRPADSVCVRTVSVGHTAGAGGTNGPLTSVGVLALLLAVFASGSTPTTVAVLIRTPGSSGRTTTVIVAAPLRARVPSEQRIVAPPVHTPWLDRTETKSVPSGSESATFTFVAVSGPAFRTVSV